MKSITELSEFLPEFEQIQFLKFLFEFLTTLWIASAQWLWWWESPTDFKSEPVERAWFQAIELMESQNFSKSNAEVLNIHNMVFCTCPVPTPIVIQLAFASIQPEPHFDDVQTSNLKSSLSCYFLWTSGWVGGLPWCNHAEVWVGLDRDWPIYCHHCSLPASVWQTSTWCRPIEPPDSSLFDI